ncbi:N-acetylglucosamine kinase [Microbacterium sp. 22303]|uniref:N-acetylglucosamine kinase n=1 Tax=Microbacterium sp. 22303 TaxID=3453905 RepID=UPI003F876C97
MTASSPSVLAIDAGQSSIKVRHLASGVATEWTTPALRTDQPLPPQLAEVLRSAVGRGLAADAVGIGASGLGDDGMEAVELRELVARLGAGSLIIAHDSITAFLGALGDGQGAVVAAGTGVVTLAVGRTEVARVDGWGHLLGDAGSGYWIGRAALDAVLRANDGRGPRTELSAAVRAEFPVLEETYLQLQADPGRVRRIAAYARPVAEAAADGDPVAIGISRAAAEELAHSVVSGLRRVGGADADADAVRGGADGARVLRDPDVPVSVRAIGGVLGSTVLATAFEEAVRRRIPSADVRIGSADPLDGAALLPAVADASALRSRLVRIDV